MLNATPARVVIAACGLSVSLATASEPPTGHAPQINSTPPTLAKPGSIDWIQSATSGTRARPGSMPDGPSARNATDLFNTWSVDPAFSGLVPLDLNLSYLDGGCYDANPATLCNNGNWILGASTQGTTSPAPVFDPATPNDPNDDFTVDAAFDDYDIDPALWPDAPGVSVPLTSMRWAFVAQNTEPFTTSTNGTPFDTSDDLVVQPDRTNRLSILWWSIDDQGTPFDPDDDRFVLEDGVIFTLTLDGGQNGLNPRVFNLFTNQDLTAIGGVAVPRAGYFSFDWDNIAPGSQSNDDGLWHIPSGGDLGSDPRGSIDNLPIPHPDTITRDEGRPDHNAWRWMRTSDPQIASYNDLDPFGLGADLSFTARNIGTDATGKSELAHNLLVSFATDFQPCPADLTGSSDPNDPSFGTRDGDADSDDFFFYLDAFSAPNLAICDFTGSSDPNDPSYATPDGDCDGDDFFFYLSLFVAGCP